MALPCTVIVNPTVRVSDPRYLTKSDLDLPQLRDNAT